MSDASENDRLAAARLASPRTHSLHHLLDPAVATRRLPGSKTRDPGGSNLHSHIDSGWDHRRKGGPQMSYHNKVARELEKVYEELLKTPPIVMLILSCLAVLLVGAIVVGATR